MISTRFSVTETALLQGLLFGRLVSMLELASFKVQTPFTKLYVYLAPYDVLSISRRAMVSS
jgi:hypothetical protein